MKTQTFVLAAVMMVGCGVGSEALVDDGVLVEEADATAEASQDVKADVLNVVPMNIDIATGNVEGRLARVLTSSTAAKALLGPTLPSITFSRNWLVAYRPEGKSPRSRVEVKRAQLSATGTTLTMWATVTEPGAGCQAWRPNELSVVRVPSRAKVPTSIRVYLTRETFECGLTVGPTCTPGPGPSMCSGTATPLCLGAYERADGSFTSGTCVKLPRYENSSHSCSSDAACGAGGICAGLAYGPEGLCQPSWMRGTYSMPEAGQLSAPLPRDGSWYRLIVPVTGQSTVPMDAWLQVFIDGATTNTRVRLSNPSGTTSSTLVPGGGGVQIPVGVPGDESINGEWSVEVQDVGTSGAPAVLRGVRLSVTSRWD
ncbi:MAG: hypothetical protein Q8L14_12455 [Myxococcales bacterium]|nr:hypothetical protein [Myxococcales bacterium]